jgi:FG-GAP-like repeat
MIIFTGTRCAVVSLLACVLLSACGGGGGGGDSANAPPANQVPLANAGADATFFRAELVTLDGTASSDPEGASLTYSWTQTGGPSVTLSGVTSARPTFTTPRASGMLTFALVVNDGRNSSAADSISIIVQNRVPIANAGNDRIGTFGQAIEIDVSGSSDPDGDVLTYTWTQISGPSAAVTPLGGAKFVFGAVNATSARTYGLVVSDGELTSAEDIIVITVTASGTNTAPVVDAGVDQVVPRGGIVTLSGLAADPDGHAVTVRWEQLAGPAVVLSSTTSISPTFTAPLSQGTLQFRLTGTDGMVEAPSDVVTITLQNRAPIFSSHNLLPNPAIAADELVALAQVVDPDQDPITLSYRWTKNGTIIAGATSARIPPLTFRRGDHMIVTMTASDGLLSTSQARGIFVSDAPPQVSFNAPATVEHRGLFEYDIHVTDADGDGPSFRLEYGPAGMQVDDDGHVTWAPNQPMFDRQLDVSWSIVVASGGSDSVYARGTTRITDADREYPLRRTGMDTWYIDEGIQVLDLDGDGDEEILVASPSSIYELRREGSAYAQSWVHPFWPGGAGITALATGDTNGDGHQEIFFAAGDIHMLDGATRRIATFVDHAPGVQCFNLVSADLDRNGDRELVCNRDEPLPGSERLVVYGAHGQVRWQTPAGFDAGVVKIANVDSDPQLEIVTRYRVYDGIAGTVQADLRGLFPAATDVGDVTGDGIAEIITIDPVAGMQAVQVATESSVWSVAAGSRDLAKTVDLDGDGRTEVLVASKSRDTIRAFRRNLDGTTALLFETPDTTVKLQSLATGDPDHDGSIEIVYAGEITPGPGVTRFDVVSTGPTPVSEWSASPTTLQYPFVGAHLARTSGNQRRLIFGVAQTDIGTAGTRILAMDPLTGAVTMSSEIGRNQAGTLAIELVDTDGDGRDEVFTATNDGGDGYFAFYDPVSRTVEHRTPMAQDMGATVASAHYDFTGDGTDELVTLGRDGYVRVYDLIQQTVLWRSPTADASPKDLVVFDADYDATKEIIVAGSQGITTYYMQDPTDFTPLNLDPGIDGAVVDLLAADTDPGEDSAEELFVLTSFNEIHRLDWHYTRFGPWPQLPFDAPPGTGSLHLEDLDAPRKNLVVSAAVNEVQGLVGIDATNGNVIWQSPDVSFTTSDSLHYVDVNGDGEREIAFGTRRGMFVTR